MKPLALAVALAALALLSVEPLDARQLGLSCTISTTGVAFGGYSVFDTDPTEADGTITYRCTLGILVRVELDKGWSTTFDPRIMKDGTKPPINYNLFMDAGYGTIWGDGSNSTGRLTQIVTALFSHQARVYGKIPPGQDVKPGSYSDSVTATLVF